MDNVKKARIDFRNNIYYIVSCLRDVDGIWFDGSRVETCELGSGESVIGSLVLNAIGESRRCLDVSSKSRRGGELSIVRAAGVASWREYLKGVKSVSVRSSPAGYKITPYRNGGLAGAGRGLEPISERAVELGGLVDEGRMGQVVVRAIDQCE